MSLRNSWTQAPPGCPLPLALHLSPHVWLPLPANGTPASVYRVLGHNFIHWENTHSFSFPVLKFQKGRGIGSTWVKTPPMAHSVVAWGWGLTKALWMSCSGRVPSAIQLSVAGRQVRGSNGKNMEPLVTGAWRTHFREM